MENKFFISLIEYPLPAKKNFFDLQGIVLFIVHRNKILFKTYFVLFGSVDGCFEICDSIASTSGGAFASYVCIHSMVIIKIKTTESIK